MKLLRPDELDSARSAVPESSPAGKAAPLAYRPDIDGLRALAVLAVLAYHVAPKRFSGGFVGVDIFFVISGFLISSIIYSELKKGTFSIVQFYVRRIRRIYPALLLILLSAALAGWILALPRDYKFLGSQIAGGSAFVANFVLWGQAGYLDGPVETKPLLHLWSLGIEEQYYLVFPLICLLFYRRSPRRALPVVFALIAIGSMAANVIITGYDRNAAFYLPLTRFWELFLGAGLALHQDIQGHAENKAHHFHSWKTLAGVSGAALVAASILFIVPSDAFPGWWAALPCLGTTLLIWAGPASWVNRVVFSFRPAVFVGLISYPLYLWHWPLLSFLKIAQGNTGLPRWQKVAVILASFLLAWLTLQWIEKPVRRSAHGPWRGKGALLLLGGVFLAGVFGVIIVFTGGIPNRFSPQIQSLDHDFDAAAVYRDGSCFLRPNQSAGAFTSQCLDPDPTGATPLLLLWGDSHAADLYPGFRFMQRTTPVRLAQYTASSCPPVLGLEIPTRPSCRSINDAVFEKIRRLNPAIVVLSAFWSDGVNTEPAALKFRDTVVALKSLGIPRIVVIGSVPLWKRPVPYLLITEIQAHPDRAMPSMLPDKFVIRADDRRIISALDGLNVVYISPIGVLCDGDGCLAAGGTDWKTIVVFDTAHFTAYGSAAVAQRMWTDILGSQ